MDENLSSAWKNAQIHITKAQKRHYDRHADEKKVRKDDRVMFFIMQGRDWKLACPYHGPYRVLNGTLTNVEVSLIDKAKDPSIFINFSRSSDSLFSQVGKSVLGLDIRNKKLSPKSVLRTLTILSQPVQTNDGHR